MVEPEKPFACTMPDCGMTFTNEDHLHVHTKKHDMYLQLGLEQKAAFVADQTPTPTRFIRNCEEVGLFQDLQNVNPFEEGFKRAMETCKHGMLSLDSANPPSTTEDLHTPQMFPLIDPGDSALFTTNNHKNITISRSSSDESGTIKEYETTTISKLTNEVTTISRIVNKHDVLEKIHVTDDVNAKNDETVRQTDVHNETSVSYTNNVIKIHNNIEIRKDNLINVETTRQVPNTLISYDSITKDERVTRTQDAVVADNNKNDKLPPIMSQKSIDLFVDNLTSDLCQNNKPEVKMRSVQCNKTNTVNNNVDKEDNIDNARLRTEDYEVIIKLPNGKQVKMKAVEETEQSNAKERLKKALNNKVTQKTLQRLPSVTTVQNIVPITAGTLIPVTILNTRPQMAPKVPIPACNLPKVKLKTVKRRVSKAISTEIREKASEVEGCIDGDDDCVIVGETQKKRSREDLDSRVAASRRYRLRLRETMQKQADDIKQLQEANLRLTAEKAALKLLITEHMKSCPNADHLRITQEKLLQSNPKL